MRWRMQKQELQLWMPGTSAEWHRSGGVEVLGAQHCGCHSPTPSVSKDEGEPGEHIPCWFRGDRLDVTPKVHRWGGKEAKDQHANHIYIVHISIYIPCRISSIKEVSFFHPESVGTSSESFEQAESCVRPVLGYGYGRAKRFLEAEQSRHVFTKSQGFFSSSKVQTNVLSKFPNSRRNVPTFGPFSS